VVFCRKLFVFSPFSLSHSIVFGLWMYGFSIPLWYLQIMKMDDRYFRRFQIMFLLPFFYCKFSFLEYQISCLIFLFKFQLIFQRLFMYSISLIRKIQARFQPSPLDNWISNGKVLNLGYEKPLLKPSFPEFNVDIMR
jgi:hypothetical protein